MSVLGSAIGERVRFLRAVKQVTLGQLARGSGLGKATLSDLEAGRSNPTIETLFAIATFLDVPLTALVRDTAGPTFELLRVSDRPRLVGHHRLRLDLLTRFSAGDVTLELSQVEFRAKGHHQSPPHSEGVVERLIVHRGVLRVGPLENPVSLKPGDFLSFSADVSHIYEAGVEDVVATLLIQYPTVEPPMSGLTRGRATPVQPTRTKKPVRR
jgi:transcriptional regulator with XRE-family HTH domain